MAFGIPDEAEITRVTDHLAQEATGVERDAIAGVQEKLLEPLIAAVNALGPTAVGLLVAALTNATSETKGIIEGLDGWTLDVTASIRLSKPRDAA